MFYLPQNVDLRLLSCTAFPMPTISMLRFDLKSHFEISSRLHCRFFSHSLNKFMLFHRLYSIGYTDLKLDMAIMSLSVSIIF